MAREWMNVALEVEGDVPIAARLTSACNSSIKNVGIAIALTE
jgi:hypothetical protein